MVSARELVVTALLDRERRNAWSNLVLDKALRRSTLPPQDKRFATALFYGVLSYQNTLDFAIQQEASRAISTIDSTVKTILRCGIYQLLYMDSVPDHAAVNESVGLTKTLRVHSAGGFVNGVLRAFLRSKKNLRIPENTPLEQRLGILYSCPPETVAFLLASYGEPTTIEVLSASLVPPPTFLRVNTLRDTTETLRAALAEQGVLAEETGVPHCLRVQQGGALDVLEHGRFHVQDIASQQAALAVNAAPGQRVLDTCAAPGGKTFILAQAMQNTGELIATDLHQHRLNQLNDRAHTLGITNTTTLALDMKEYHPHLGEFDRVLVDVPCAGMGVWRRRPEMKYTPLLQYEGLPAVQRALLFSAARYCKTGGLLVYSTCTLSPHENGEIVQAFLAEHPHFSFAEQAQPPEQTLLPGDNGGDGFYTSVLQRTT